MTMRLKRVELENIRSHTHIVFEPNETGITALRGDSGSGKSTIVDSIAWALYGTKPNGVSKTINIYRRGAVFPEDKCYSRVDLIVDDVELRIERKMVSKTGAVECLVTELQDDGDYKDLAGPAVSHAEEYIRKRLRMNEKSFLSAIFVQQKQVDNLIVASPRERGEIIEKLTGVSALAYSMDSAKSESKALKKSIELSAVDKAALPTLEKELEDGRETRDKLRKKVDKLKTRLDSERESSSEWTEKAQEQRDIVSRRESLSEQLESNSAPLSEYKTQKETLVDERAKLKAQIEEANSPRVTDIEEALKPLEEARQRLQEAQVTLSVTRQSHQTKTNSLEEVIEKLGENGDVRPGDNRSALDRSQATLESITGKLETLQSEKSNLNSELRVEKKSLKALEAVLKDTGSGVCPTCRQALEDHSREALENELSSLESKVSGINKGIGVLDERITKGNVVREKTQSKIQELNELQGLLESRDKLREDLEELSKSEKSQSNDVTTQESEVKALERGFSALEKHRELLERYSTVQGDLSRALKSFERYEARDRKVRSELKTLPDVSKDKAAESLRRSQELQKSVQEISEKYNANSQELAVLEERLVNLEEKVETERVNSERYAGMLKRSEQLTASVSLLSEFRQDRIDNAVPIIEQFASDLLNRFTEGSFVKLQIDSKFQIHVTPAGGGAASPVGLLSGGELSAAAMALRLAVSLMMNLGNSQNLLILDEVLVSQDSNRAGIILTAIKEVCEGQVILIAHNGNVDEVVDSVVILGDDEEG